MYAEIIVNRPTHRQPPAGSEPLRADTSRQATYTYRLPDALRDMAMVGQLVQVPLGPSTALGVIAALTAEPPPDLDPGLVIRDVAEILDLMPVATPVQIKLARWIADEYLEPLSQAMRMMLPPGLEERTFVVATQPAGKTGQADASELAPQETAALRLLRRRGGRVPLSTLLGHIRDDDPEAVVNTLVEKGLLDTRYALVPPQPAPPRIQFVRLLADDNAIDAALPHLGHSSKQADVLLILARRGDAPLTLPELCALAGCTESPVRALVTKGWVEITPRRTLVVALPGATGADLDRAPKQSAVLRTLLAEGGPQDLRHIQAATDASTAVIAALEKKGWVQRIQQEPVVLLTLPPDEVLDRVIELRGAEVERAILQALRGTTGRVWVGGIYAETGAGLDNLRNLAGRGLVSLHAEEYDRPQIDAPQAPPILTPDQRAVWQRIESGMARDGLPGAGFVALLHGVTGSGKTEIYLRALEATLAAGRRAIVLVPEISLTAQTVRRFETRFPSRVAVIHSQLSMGQRYAVWDCVRRGEADVVIGPRSALLAPVSRLGLIVLDEAHDDSYKQTEPIPLPAYQARDVARALGRLTGATVLFGSATPDLGTYYRATQGEYCLLQLPHRIRASEPGLGRLDHSRLPPVRVVDLRQELRAGNRSIFSRPLQQALGRLLDAGEQAILFLNRRGAATFILCRDCGYVARCPDCEVPLTLHRAAHSAPVAGSEVAMERLVCHHCNRQEVPPTRCPSCGGRRIRYFGLGTERVESAVRELHPEARLLRWDRDTATGADHERFLQAFLEHRADILVGTQMIAKGLDLPLVTLVGVISADTALYLPDYRAAERTFQLLTQVGGRAGRSHRGGQVIIQTYNPSHYAIQAAADHDYAGFYRQELAYRRQLAYPPFSRLVALRRSDRDPHRVRIEAERLGRWLTQEIRRRSLPVSLIGPTPCFFSRVQGRYRWQIVLRAPDPLPVLRHVALPRGWRADVDPVSLL
ncbi:MAG: primosomal protein N' [Anaerolineae bacterium]|jgi:primosomal protein N' (replication factor Y)